MMDKTYNPQAIENHWYPIWEKKGYFKPTGSGDAYCIMIPPPNVTGTLHMGHAFQHTLMDISIRYHRMLGNNTHWQAGTDHAGIATQMVVERLLSTENTSRLELGRENFVNRVWQWKEQSGGTISHQMRRLGDSPDWTQERFTMDKGLSEAVTEVFVRLYEEGLIYRGQRLVNWDPVLLTAISDLEVVTEEEDGYLWHIRYPLENNNEHLIVATTRPETLLGDTAVAIHPDDTRYKHLLGKKIRLPLTGRLIPIIADEYVDPKFGSGCVKITPAHDFNDYAIGQRHQLPTINIFTPDARINENAPAQYQGLDRYEARERIINDLQSAELLEKTVKHKLMVPRGDRTHAVTEPYLTNQWFVKIKPLAEPAIQAVEEGRIRFVPENWCKTYFNWMNNIEDWCISRQLWWGHRIPAWFDDTGKIYVGRSEEEIRRRYALKNDIYLQQDEDVLDTWFSSALWPFSTLNWPQQTEALKHYYPSQVLITGFDIIFFWVARMIMMGLKFMDDVPFREVYITGLIRDEHGQKMSKSKGNILDPLDLMDGIGLEDLVKKRSSGLMQPHMAAKIETATRKQYPHGIPGYGADALRFTLASLASTGRDIRFDMKRMEGYRNFCNKLWNAARYVLISCEGKDNGLNNNEPLPGSLPDRWIISRLQQLQQAIVKHLNNYRFDLAAQDIYEFTWNEYCDWYIEFSKPVLQAQNIDPAISCATRKTLLTVLETLLRMAHPFIPFITEEIWQQIASLTGKTNDSIMLENYPTADSSKLDTTADHEISWIKNIILSIRRIRAEMDISPSAWLKALLQNGNQEDRQLIIQYHDFICALAKLSSLTWLDSGQNAPEAATAIAGDVKILIPLAGLIDKNTELLRLNKEIEKNSKERERIQGKLQNTQFIAKAPEEIVNKERQKLHDLENLVYNLKEQAEKIKLL